MGRDQKRVLVVDDEENIRHMLKLMLTKEGYFVETADDGMAALEMLRSADYDIVLCDVQMPRLTGIELLENLQNEGLSTTVIVMSAYGTKDSAIEAMKKGAYDYISKPAKKDEILLTFRKADERERLFRENRVLREAALRESQFENIVATSAAMKRVFETVRKVADYPTTILISGESGTGKELIARAIHFNSNRASQQFVAVNCGAIPENLLESELFGYVRGAFTGAQKDKQGLFVEADGGTLFLDEISELSYPLQVKLLRVLQENEIRRVGDTRTISVNARIVAACAKPLLTRVESGTFREDLYYRLNVMPITLPPLRERQEDIPLLVEFFVQKIGKTLGSSVTGISPAAQRTLEKYGWPGNVRELENTIERAIVMTEGATIRVDALPETVQMSEQSFHNLLGGEDLSIKRGNKALERMLIEKALRRTNGNRTRAAKLLEISHRALIYKIKEYDLAEVR